MNEGNRQILLYQTGGRLAVTHRFIVADGVDLSAKHDGSEGEEEERLQAKEDHEHDGHRRGEVTALCTGEGKTSTELHADTCSKTSLKHSKMRACLRCFRN